MTDAVATPAELGTKYIRWGFGLFIFGLVVGFIPLAHYMHGSFEPVEEAFLKNVTLWWGCAFTLAVYVAQVGSLAMIVIGLCYVVFARDGAMTSVTAAERIAPALCAVGIIAEFVAGVAAIMPLPRSGRTSTTPRLRHGKCLARVASRLHRSLSSRRHPCLRRHPQSSGSKPMTHVSSSWWAPPGQTKYLIVQGADDQIAPPENGFELKKELGERVNSTQ